MQPKNHTGDASDASPRRIEEGLSIIGEIVAIRSTCPESEEAGSTLSLMALQTGTIMESLVSCVEPKTSRCSRLENRCRITGCNGQLNKTTFSVFGQRLDPDGLQRFLGES